MSISWDFLRSEIEGVSLHEIIVDNTGLVISCDYIYCNYQEQFETADDAAVAGEIHSRLE